MYFIYFVIKCVLLSNTIRAAVPILPIITAIASSGSSVLNVDIDSLGIAKWMSESTKMSTTYCYFY